MATTIRASRWDGRRCPETKSLTCLLSCWSMESLDSGKGCANHSFQSNFSLILWTFGDCSDLILLQKLGGLSYFGGAEKKDERVLVPDLGSLTSIYDRWVEPGGSLLGRSFKLLEDFHLMSFWDLFTFVGLQGSRAILLFERRAGRLRRGAQQSLWAFAVWSDLWTRLARSKFSKLWPHDWFSVICLANAKLYVSGFISNAGNYPEWDEDHPIHFVGHSAGAQVVRVLQQMLADKVSLIRISLMNLVQYVMTGPFDRIFFSPYDMMLYWF